MLVICVASVLMGICVVDALIGIVGSIEALSIELMTISISIVMMSNIMVFYLLIIEGRSKHSCGNWG